MPDSESEVTRPEVDACMPVIMQCVMDDINGLSQEDRDVEDVQRKSFIREIKGNKANDILETIARCLLFRPSYALNHTRDDDLDDIRAESHRKDKIVNEKEDNDNKGNVNISSMKIPSAIHEITSPMLLALVSCEDGAMIGRIGEGLQRVAQGLSKNPSAAPQELMLYIYSTLQPFVESLMRALKQKRLLEGRLLSSTTESYDEEESNGDLPSYLVEDESSDDDLFINSPKRVLHKKKGKDNVSGYEAAAWTTSRAESAASLRQVLRERDRERKELHEVSDGASAPRLSGFDRERGRAQTRKLGGADTNPATVCAVKYCLTLLCAALRHDRIDLNNSEVKSMAIPYLPLLYHCLQLSTVPEVVVMAMRALSMLLAVEVPMERGFSKALGNIIMKILFRGGALVTIDNELVQTSLRGLTAIFQAHQKQCLQEKSGEGEDSKSKKKNRGNKLPFPAESVRSLIQLLTSSVMEMTTSYQSASFQLIRAIVDSNVLLPEIYDLMEKIIEQTVLSHRKGVRESASSTVVAYILGYPLGEKRMSSHMKQFLNNCSYDYEEGRLSALALLESMVKLLPPSVLLEYANMIFLSLSLRVVNDPATGCRKQAADVILALIRRLDTTAYNTLLEYATTWLYSVKQSKNTYVSQGCNVELNQVCRLSIMKFKLKTCRNLS